MTVATLVEEAGELPIDLTGDPAVTVTGITIDSRSVREGDVFCCVRGAHLDGHELAGTAVAAGAAALVVDHLLDLAAEVPQLVVADTREAVGPLADALWGHPSRRLTMVGVTGTNGKTTTCYLLAAILEAAGWPIGVLGTLTGSFTTPEAPELQARLAELAAEGTRAVAMEVSSHALAFHRVDGTRFRIAVFTNLGRDHLDLHGTPERYFAAKAGLFVPELTDHGVVNADDVRGRQLLDLAAIPTTAFTLADADVLDVGPAASRFRWRGERVELPLGGRFNVANALAAATTAEVLGIDVGTIATGLSSTTPIPGRMEVVDAGQPFRVVVDFAHTPDALAGLLAELRAVTGGRVIVVFGCGGDRDREKRPLMGRAAAEGADLVVVTSDNPRSEPPEEIIAAVAAGVPVPRRGNLVTEADRRAAIALALDAAAPGDVVAIAGKGHETTQTVAGERRPFDDRVVARVLLEERQ
jgi:UDP-N-acetylmuramoyl-L-alanyl-D-glutamate--2,6-diaminopimelate ligase